VIWVFRPAFLKTSETQPFVYEPQQELSEKVVRYRRIDVHAIGDYERSE
jgi:hypothetical protein